MKRVDPHWLDVFDHTGDGWHWICSCGVSGLSRRQDLAGEAFRCHVDEMDEVAA